MDKLPQEVIDRIVFYLPGRPTFISTPRPPSPLPQFATISTKFQAAVERRTFRSLSIKSDETELQVFQASLSPPRRANLRQLDYSVVLPSYDESAACSFETKADQNANNKAFTTAVRELFSILRGWDGADEIQPRNLSLCIADVFSPPDLNEAGSRKDTKLRLYRYLRSRIRLENYESLPTLSCVTTLAVVFVHRIVAPSTAILLAARLPRLRALHITAYAEEMRYPTISRNDRHELATALMDALARNALSTVNKVVVEFEQGDGPENQLVALPNLVFPEDCDPLGTALRHWSQHTLESLTIRGVFDGSLFWPPETLDSPPALWANLERLDVQLSRNTPEGWWYFMPQGRPKYGTAARNPAKDPHDGPPPHDDTGRAITAADARAEETWAMSPDKCPPRRARLTRNVPCEDTMQPLYLAWAKALQHAPRLREAKLAFRVEIQITDQHTGELEEEPYMEDWELVYQAPDVEHEFWHAELQDAEQKSRRLFFHNMCGWRPNEATMGLLRQAGRETWHDTEMVELAVNEYDKIQRELID